jgi:hypothetical protein
MEPPRLSVVLPLGDHRGLAAESLTAWTRQSLPPVLYEVVAVDDGRRRRLTERVCRALRPHDSLVVREGGSEIELYQAGAEAARGEFLLFTESHAVPTPTTAEGLLGHLDRTGSVAASLSSAHLPRQGLAVLEERLGEVVRRERTADRWWAGVSLRGFAVRRQLFQELGGFRSELERFAETALAIEMDRRGLRANEAQGAVVAHGDCRWPGELERALLSLGRGRRAYHDTGPADTIEPYVGRPGPLTRSVVDAGLARALCTDIVRSRLALRWPAARREHLAALRRFALVALAGASGAKLPLRVQARLSLLACMLPWGDAGGQRLARFRRAWRQVSTCGEIQYLARQPLPPPTPPRAPLRFDADARETDFVGFHCRESDEAGPFRWTQPAALWRLALPRGDYRARLRLSLPPDDPELRLSLNGRAVAPVPECPCGDTVSFAIPPELLREGDEQRLGLLSAPYRPRERGSTDGRTLGVAVRWLDLEPRGSGGRGVPGSSLPPERN